MQVKVGVSRKSLIEHVILKTLAYYAQRNLFGMMVKMFTSLP